MTPPVALTIAGSDSGGGAGIQADLKTFAALGVFGTTAVTAITVQNTAEVRRVVPVPTELVVAQIEAVLDGLPVTATKTGMLATAETIAAVGALAAAGRLPQLVVDPVLVSSTGASLLDDGAHAAYVEHVLPAAMVVTPNLDEAGVLLDTVLLTLADQRDAAKALADLGPSCVVVTGGHATADTKGEAVDVCCDGGSVTELRSPRIASENTHGSGCTFASAIAAGLARGVPVGDAIHAAKSFVHRAIEAAEGWQLGAGPGPLDHFAKFPIPKTQEQS